VNCEEFTDQVLLYAAGALSDREAEEVRGHLSAGCPTCAGKLAEAQATLALLALSLPPEAPPQEVRQRLLLAIGSSRAPRTAQMPRGAGQQMMPVSWMSQLAMTAAIAATIAVVVSLFFAMRMQTRQASQFATASEEAQHTLVMNALLQQQQELISQRSVLLDLSSWAAEPNLKVISLDGTNQQPTGAHARVFWDADHQLWHFFATGLKPPPPGKTYELWFVTTDAKTKIPAGNFDPNSTGNAELVSTVPADIAPRLTIGAVTDEPSSGKIESPTGSFQLEGALQ
jgi:hypothetical protein